MTLPLSPLAPIAVAESVTLEKDRLMITLRPAEGRTMADVRRALARAEYLASCPLEEFLSETFS